MATKNLPKSIWKLAERDYDVASNDELYALGYSRGAVRHRVKIGKLHPKGPGVYAIGSPHLTRYGRWMVEVKGCRPDAVLSFLTAAVLWGIWQKEPRVDFYFRELNLVVECDSLRYHRTQLQQAQDAARDHAHFVAGRERVRFTHHHVARARTRT